MSEQTQTPAEIVSAQVSGAAPEVVQASIASLLTAKMVAVRADAKAFVKSTMFGTNVATQRNQ